MSLFGGLVKPKIDIDPQKIEEVLSRSISQILPSREVLEKALKSGERLKIYIGADATGPQLHLGHATNFILLEKLRKLGHEIVVLFGDFTAMIGDPTDKDAARTQLTESQVNEYIRSWKDQVSKIVSFSDRENPARVLKNSEWLSKLDFGSILKLASNFTVQQMIERDMFDKRLKEQKPVYLHEFLYPLMQGYDSVVMNVDVEIGGTDQMFNMLAGRTLQRKINNKEKFVISTTLLENPKTGKKLMSKSEGGYIALNDVPNEMYGKTMALPDEVLVQMFTDCTYVSLGEISQINEKISSGENPKNIKMHLAREIVSIYHGKDAAEKAEANWEKTFSGGGVPEDVPIVAPGKLRDIVKDVSTSELRRLVVQGAVSSTVTGAQIESIDTEIKDDTIRIGKHKFIKVIKER